MEFSIEPFLQYGILGIIGFIFLRYVNKILTNNSNQFESLLKTLIEQKTEPTEQLQQSINNILQTLYTQHTQEMQKTLEESSEAWKIFMEHENLTKDQIIAWENLLLKFKSLLVDMRNHNGLTQNQKRIGEILMEKGYITFNQLQEALQEQNKEDE
jgi:hypothetical protein